MTTVAEDVTRAAFEAFAEVYDTFTAHHDYELWIGAIERIARQHGLSRAGRMLDVGAGTGKSLLPWLDRGWAVTACDNSPAMLARARAKAGARANFVEADARALGDLGRFDLVQILDDVVNYLPPEDLGPLFRGVAANLAPDGRCVFDLSTRRLLADFFSSVEVAEGPGQVVLWRGRAPAEIDDGAAVEADLDAFVETGAGWERRRGLHRQHHHPVAEVERVLWEAGLCVEGVYGQDFSARFEPGVDESRHTKSVLIARHANAPDPRRR